MHGGDERYASDPYWKDLVLFYEYFHGDTGRGVGASHQTGWTALIVRSIEEAARRRSPPVADVGGRRLGLTNQVAHPSARMALKRIDPRGTPRRNPRREQRDDAEQCRHTRRT